MSRDYLEAALKDLHQAESDRADKLDGAVNLPTAILTVLLGAGTLYLDKLPRFSPNVWVVAFYATALMYFFAVIRCVYCVLRSYYRYQYRLVANPVEIVFYEEQYRKYYSEKCDDGDEVDNQVKEELRDFLIEQFSTVSDHNRKQTLTRVNWLYRTTQSIIISLVFLAISRLLFYEAADISPKPQEVQVIGFPNNIKVQAQTPASQTIKIDGTPRIDIGNQKMEITNLPNQQKVELIEQLPVQRVEIIEPKKGP